jgi:GNAT superfamily N-acetyltransferase
MNDLKQITPPGDGADAHWVVADGAAQCSLWWSNVPSYSDQRFGVIGHYEARDDGAAGELLAHGCRELAARGCTLAVGPMDGNTWRKYRFVTERGDEPAFFLEPDNPDAWPGQFAAQGFMPLAQYYSALNTDLSRADERAAARWRDLSVTGITIRPLEIGRFEGELRAIYALSTAAFTRNFLYTPISEAEFMAQYQKVRSFLRPDLILMAEQAGRLVGYMFALPNVVETPVRTVILKTVAVLPERASAGLGAVLVDRVQQVARELGYTRAIHALMHETNRSRNISRHTAAPFRRYTLFAKPLAP